VPFDGERPLRGAAALRIPPPKPSAVQKRTDASSTAYKLHAWSLTEFDLVLAVDLDILLHGNPLPHLRAAWEASIAFSAASDVDSRTYLGIQSSIMLLRPNADVHAILLANAAMGHFVPFTQGDQDVIESTMPHHVALAAPDGQLRRNRGRRYRPPSTHLFHHGCLMEEPWRATWLGASQAQARIATGVAALRLGNTGRSFEYQFKVLNPSTSPAPWVVAADLHGALAEHVMNCWGGLYSLGAPCVKFAKQLNLTLLAEAVKSNWLRYGRPNSWPFKRWSYMYSSRGKMLRFGKAKRLNESTIAGEIAQQGGVSAMAL